MRYLLHLQPQWWLSTSWQAPAPSPLKPLQCSHTLQASHSEAILPAILAHSCSSCTTAVFYEHYPHKQTARLVALLQHSSLASVWTWCWLSSQNETLQWTALMYLHSNRSSTQLTVSNVQPLPTRVNKYYRQHTPYRNVMSETWIKNIWGCC